MIDVSRDRDGFSDRWSSEAANIEGSKDGKITHITCRPGVAHGYIPPNIFRRALQSDESPQYGCFRSNTSGVTKEYALNRQIKYFTYPHREWQRGVMSPDFDSVHTLPRDSQKLRQLSLSKPFPFSKLPHHISHLARPGPYHTESESTHFNSKNEPLRHRNLDICTSQKHNCNRSKHRKREGRSARQQYQMPLILITTTHMPHSGRQHTNQRNNRQQDQKKAQNRTRSILFRRRSEEQRPQVQNHPRKEFKQGKNSNAKRLVNLR